VNAGHRRPPVSASSSVLCYRLHFHPAVIVPCWPHLLLQISFPGVLSRCSLVILFLCGHVASTASSMFCCDMFQCVTHARCFKSPAPRRIVCIVHTFLQSAFVSTLCTAINLVLFRNVRRSDKCQRFQLNELDSLTSTSWRQNCVIFVTTI